MKQQTQTAAAESGMTAAVNDRFGGVLWEVRAVGFVFFAVQHTILAAVSGINSQAAVGQVGGGVGRQQHQTVQFIGVLGRIACRHGPAQRVPTDVPVCDFGKAFRDAVRRVPIQYGQIAGHLYQHAQNAVLGKVVQEGSIGGVFHLAARIEDHPGGGRFRRKDPVAVLPGDAHEAVRHQCILGGGVCVVVVADVNVECDADGQQNSQQAEEHSEGKRFFLLVLHRTPLFYKHFPQSLQPLQINLLPQVSQFARKWGT